VQIELAGQEILQAAVPVGRRFRHLPACREKSPPNPDRRKDHSFFIRAIAVIGRLTLPDDVPNGQDSRAARWRNNEGTFAMANRGHHCDRQIVRGFRPGPRP
jgi:hypothetical protein